MLSKRNFKRLLIAFLFIVIFANIIAAFHAYKFTHFNPEAKTKTKNPEEISFSQKLKTLLFGISNPRPANKIFPTQKFEVVNLQSNKKIECWKIKTTNSKGTVLIFHGYSGQKSSMLDKGEIFLNLGYNVLLVDFMGSGGSEGNQTTIGFHEAVQVKDAYEFIEEGGEKNIILFGTSMGAAAIMKAQSEYNLNVSALILECPFGTMLETVRARFKAMKAPVFPMANLLVFWGGVENKFNAFAHNPVDYSKNISCPVLLMYGEKDINVSKKETDEIYNNLQGTKELKTYPLSGHENYLIRYKHKWTDDVSSFLNKLD